MNHALALLLAGASAAVIATGAVGTLAEEGEPAPVEPVRIVAQAPPPPRGEACLSDADLREAVAEKRVVPPFAAIRAARAAVSPAEIQRARLCRQNDGLVYLLTALRGDGHFVQVFVDAKSGQVSGQR